MKKRIMNELEKMCEKESKKRTCKIMFERNGNYLCRAMDALRSKAEKCCKYQSDRLDLDFNIRNGNMFAYWVCTKERNDE